MPSTMPRTKDQFQIQILDERGRVIGVITHPVAPEALGPGREKVYLARARPERASHAA